MASIEQNNRIVELERKVADLEAAVRLLLADHKPKRETLSLKKPVNGTN